jgi:capsule polysaccharide modification protein KpsS
VGTVEPLLDAFYMKAMATYDPFIRRYISLHVMLLRVLFHERKSKDPVAQKMMKDDYLEL